MNNERFQRVPSANQEMLDNSINNLERQFKDFFPELLKFLRHEGEIICFANLRDKNLAAMRLVPSPQITKQFGISLEIPILIATFFGTKPLEPRVLRQIDTSTELRKSASADKDFAILVATDENALQFVRDRKRFGFPILVIKTRDLREGYYRDKTLREEMSRVLRSMNHFDYSNEIISEMDFFGRLDEIDAVTNLATSGQNVGLFGLRRSGKTSLLLQIKTKLEKRGLKTIYIQLNGITDSDNLIEKLLEEMAKLLLDAKIGTQLESEFFTSAGKGKMISLETLRRRWVSEMDRLFCLLNTNLVLIIDETDLANEETNEVEDERYKDREKIHYILQHLRGLIQIQNERGMARLSFISAGVASSIFSKSIRFNRDNQLFGFASIRMLKPMNQDEMREMVRVLGKRSGLKFESRVIFDCLLKEYGGHPHLTRMACSHIAEMRTHSQKSEVPYHVTIEDLNQAINELRDGSASHTAWQTLQSFLCWYPEESDSLLEVIHNENIIADVKRVPHAIDFGLLSSNGSLQMHALRRYAINQ